MSKEDNIINKFNKDIEKIAKLRSKCDITAFPTTVMIADNLGRAFSNKEISLDTLNRSMEKLNSEALSFNIRCKCLSCSKI